MNDALKVQKNWRNEKDSAAKKCRLFENKVTADLRASVTDALIKKTPTMLCSYIGTLPCYADYQESIKAIDEQVDVECVAELESLDKQKKERLLYQNSFTHCMRKNCWIVFLDWMYPH